MNFIYHVNINSRKTLSTTSEKIAIDSLQEIIAFAKYKGLKISASITAEADIQPTGITADND